MNPRLVSTSAKCHRWKMMRIMTDKQPAIIPVSVMPKYFAEAHTQTTGFDGQTQAALNQLRDRCGMPNVPTSLGKEDGLALIKNERRIELAGEGLRSDDLSRYGDAYWSAQMNNVPISTPDGEKVITMKWDSRMSLRPIPQTAIDLNPLLATDQNPGY